MNESKTSSSIFKKTIIFITMGLIVVIVFLSLGIELLFHDGRESSILRRAACQFVGVRNQLISDPDFWGDAYDKEQWVSSINIDEASCGSALILLGSNLIDMSGAEIILGVSSNGVKYLERVEEPSKPFIALPGNHDKFEFIDKFRPIKIGGK